MNTTIDLSDSNMPINHESLWNYPTNRSSSIQDLLEEFNKDEGSDPSNPQNRDINNPSLMCIDDKMNLNSKKTRFVISRGSFPTDKIPPAKLFPFQVNLLKSIKPSWNPPIKGATITKDLKLNLHEAVKHGEIRTGKEVATLGDISHRQPTGLQEEARNEKLNDLLDRRPSRSLYGTLVSPKESKRIQLPKLEGGSQSPKKSSDFKIVKASSLVNMLHINKDDHFEFKDKFSSPLIFSSSKESTMESITKRKIFFPNSEGSSISTLPSQQGLNVNVLKSVDLFSKTSLESPTYRPIVIDTASPIKSKEINKEWKNEIKPGRKITSHKRNDSQVDIQRNEEKI